MIDRQFYTIRPAVPLSELAHQLGVELTVSGAGDDMIELPASLASSRPGSLTFFSDKRRKDQLEFAKASACLTSKTLLPLVSKTGMIGLVTENPRAAFARISRTMVSEGGSKIDPRNIDETAIIHPSAVIGDGVSIGPATKIGANSVIGDGVVIGANCTVEPLVQITFSKIGDDCIIKSGAVIGGSGFGMVNDVSGVINVPHFGRVIIHNRVQIGSNSCVDRGQLGDTLLSDDVKIDNLVQIGHNVSIGEGTMIAGHAGISGSCVIGKNCLFGGRASLADHVTVGDGAILAASAGAMADIPAGKMYSGVPAVPVREHMRSITTLKKLAQKK